LNGKVAGIYLKYRTGGKVFMPTEQKFSTTVVSFNISFDGYRCKKLSFGL